MCQFFPSVITSHPQSMQEAATLLCKGIYSFLDVIYLIVLVKSITLHCILNVKRQESPIYSVRLQATLDGEDTILQNKEDRFIPFQPTYVCAALWSAPIDCLIRDIISCSSIIRMIVSKRH